MSHKSSAPLTRVPAEKLVRDIRRATRKHLDLSRIYAYPSGEPFNYPHRRFEPICMPRAIS